MDADGPPPAAGSPIPATTTGDDQGALSRVRVVLDRPQDPVNIAGTVRAMKNMGLGWLRLVDPVDYDPVRIEGVAHDTHDIVERIRHFSSIDDAVRDCVRVAAFTARRRAAKRERITPEAAAGDLLAAASDGPVAIVFGREDKGLSNAALDRAHLVVTIPTTEHASLNLAQAVLIAAYELHLSAAAATRPIAPPRKDAPPATAEQFEQLFVDVDRALRSIDFYKSRYPELILRTVRSLAFRARPDAREIELVRAMAFEVIHALRRSRGAP